jgi:hypothetical protein
MARSPQGRIGRSENVRFDQQVVGIKLVPGKLVRDRVAPIRLNANDMVTAPAVENPVAGCDVGQFLARSCAVVAPLIDFAARPSSPSCPVWWTRSRVWPKIGTVRAPVGYSGNAVGCGPHSSLPAPLPVQSWPRWRETCTLSPAVRNSGSVAVWLLRQSVAKAFDALGRRPPRERVAETRQVRAAPCRFEQLVCDGVVADYAELARLGT